MCFGTAVNIVSRAGPGPQFAGAAGTGTQIASAVSQPGLTPTGYGVSNPAEFPVELPSSMQGKHSFCDTANAIPACPLLYCMYLTALGPCAAMGRVHLRCSKP